MQSGLQISFRPPPPLFFSLFSSFLSVIQRVHGEEKEGELGVEGFKGGVVSVCLQGKKKKKKVSHQPTVTGVF